MGLSIRERIEENERRILSPFAALAAESRGRDHPEEPCPVRTAFQRDRDRVIHCKAFRRLKHKTQVFLDPEGDHYRTRLTHTLEVAQISRTIARALGLNEDLTEALALAHDLGHTPFGHAGEEVLDAILAGGFRHFEQSLRVVQVLEREGKGLNLTVEVQDGIARHSKGRDGPGVTEEGEDVPLTLEAQVLRVADLIAYVNHDVDDATRAGLITAADLPPEHVRVAGESHSARIGRMVQDVITKSWEQPRIRMSDPMYQTLLSLRTFLFERVYENPRSRREFDKATKVVRELFAYFREHPQEIPSEIRQASGTDGYRAVCDFIAGMTDRYALTCYERLFLPRTWTVL